MNQAIIIEETQNWIKNVVIGCNFCPFAAKAVLNDKVRYVVLEQANIETCLQTTASELAFLDTSEKETTFIILPFAFAEFEDYLDMVGLVECLASDLGYDGIYQIASFHPDYCFAGSTDSDPANYTNRSIYPMLHILREASITAVSEVYPDIEGIPNRNIAFAQVKGLEFMQQLRLTKDN